MAFRFSTSTAVAAGTFNIYVIQPQWLREVKLFREGVKMKVASDFRRPGFLYTSDESPVNWDVRPDRVMLTGKNPAADCGGVLADVIHKLPWTPLTGVGVNVEFIGEPEDLERLKGCSLPTCDAIEGYARKQRTIHTALERSPHIFNLQIAAHEKIELSINVHTELTGTQEAISALAEETCRKFLALREEASRLAARQFGVEVNL